MTIFITTIPDDPKEWAGWLEQHLVGLRLRDVIDELRLLPASTSISLKSLLNEKQLSDVRQRGLSVLSVNQIRALFGSPESLLELQEDVLLHGGDYWTTIVPQPEMSQAIERVSARLSEGKWQAGSLLHSGAGFQPAIKRRSLFVLASTAALLLIGLFAWQTQPRGSGSVLGQPGVLANDVNSSAEYLTRIADAGNEWFHQPPQDATELISLLQNVCSDCQILIDADHTPLTSQERTWFVAKCEKWKLEFETTLASLRSGKLTFDAAKAEADKTMMKLVSVLRTGPTA